MKLVFREATRSLADETDDRREPPDFSEQGTRDATSVVQIVSLGLLDSLR